MFKIPRSEQIKNTAYRKQEQNPELWKRVALIPGSVGDVTGQLGHHDIYESGQLLEGLIRIWVDP
jgi:hypothetical protein